MSRTLTILTTKEVDKLAGTPGTHAVEPGLFLQVKGGSTSWLHRYEFRKAKRYSGLGPYPATTLAQARAKLKTEQAQLQQGVDPVAARRAAKEEIQAESRARLKTHTFRDVALAYIADNETSWRNPKHREQWPQSLALHVYDVKIDMGGQQVAFGDLDVKDITTDHVCAVLRPIWITKAETARRIRSRIEKMLGSAKAQGLRSGENPARLTDNIALILPRRRRGKKDVNHHAALPYAALPEFMRRLRARESTAAKALEFLILTACRTGDIIGQPAREDDRPPMMWKHVALDVRTWTIPATKNDGAHTVPLSEAAIAVLLQVRGLDDVIVFPSPDHDGQPLSNNAMLDVLARMGQGAVTVHGFRSTFRDWVGDETEFPRELAEKALAHTIGDETERAYQRGDLLKRRAKIMDAWAEYCGSHNVISLSLRAAG